MNAETVTVCDNDSCDYQTLSEAIYGTKSSTLNIILKKPTHEDSYTSYGFCNLEISNKNKVTITNNDKLVNIDCGKHQFLYAKNINTLKINRLWVKGENNLYTRNSIIETQNIGLLIIKDSIFEDMRSYKGGINLKHNKHTSITNTKFTSSYNKEGYTIHHTTDHPNRLTLKNVTIDGSPVSNDDIYQNIRKKHEKGPLNPFKEPKSLNKNENTYYTKHQSLSEINNHYTHHKIKKQ